MEQAAAAACASDFYERYRNIPENLQSRKTQDIVEAVIAALDARSREEKEQRNKDDLEMLLGDLDEYGI